ncbi:MAG: NAD(P)-dependent oxidoreductase [Lachnospiraceae bacterium]|nr:NAD(P)-dependent oxidoreductase [Lachnospiraceae bacterium]
MPPERGSQRPDGRQERGHPQSGDLTELPDCSVGLVGFGDIANKTALLHHAFGVQKTCCTRLHPLTEDEEPQYGVRYTALLELLAGSNIVSLHVPVTKETEHLADAAFFGRMQEGLLFVNTARGELVEEWHWRGTLRRESPWRNLTGVTGASSKRSYAMIWTDIEAVMDGKRPERVVNGL